jgi:nitroreductase
MLRLAPSAINIQPWRVVKTDEGYDFYAVKSKLSDKDGKKIDITYNDIGIAKYHFESTLKEDEILGKWSYKNNNYIIHDKFEYVCTWK